VDEFVLSDDLPQQHLIKPGKVGLDEALEKTIATVRAMELDDFLVVDTFGGSVRLRHGRDVGTEDLEEWSARAAAVESLPSEQDGSIYYEGLLERVLHRGFTTLTFDLDADEGPETVKRGLELAAAKRGEQDRITVKVAGPRQVSVRLRGGHRLPRVVPRKLGLARWVAAVEELIFEDTLLDEHLISPDGVSLEGSLKQVIAAVKAMELDDFLTVDGLGGRVRVRRTRDGVRFDAPRVLELFLESGDEMVDVDWKMISRRFGAIVQSLRMAVHEGGFQDRIRVSADRAAERVCLARRDMESPTS